MQSKAGQNTTSNDFSCIAHGSPTRICVFHGKCIGLVRIEEEKAKYNVILVYKGITHVRSSVGCPLHHFFCRVVVLSYHAFTIFMVGGKVLNPRPFGVVRSSDNPFISRERSPAP